MFNDMNIYFRSDNVVTNISSFILSEGNSIFYISIQNVNITPEYLQNKVHWVKGKIVMALYEGFPERQ